MIDTDMHKAQILFVDDEESTLSALKRQCRQLPWQCHFAPSGKVGLDLMASTPIDVVVSDMRMPEMNGTEFLAYVAKAYPKAICIIFSGQADLQDTVAAINKGNIFAYIDKPWDAQKLKNTLSRAIEVSQLRYERDKLMHVTVEQNQQLKELAGSLNIKVNERTIELQNSLKLLGKVNGELQSSHFATVKVFSHLIELHNGKNGRCRHVASIVQQIGEALKLDRHDIEQSVIASLLLDIGKLTIAETLFKTPFESLSETQKTAFAKHPENAEAILLCVPALSFVAELISQRYELLDGSGIPNAIFSDDLSMPARIISVVASYDDFIHGDYFSKALNQEQAINYLKQNSGTKYDASVVDAFLKILDSVNNEKSNVSDKLLTSKQLLHGMTVNQDLYTVEGLLLVAHGTILSDEIIEKLRYFEKNSDCILHVSVNKTRQLE